MALDKIKINRQIPKQEWLEFFDTFTNGNCGRKIAIEIVDREFGDEQLIQEAPLFGITYDPVGKGNDITISTGRDEASYSHRINAPKEVWTGQDENGVVLAIKITDGQGNQSIMTLK